jgi:Tol biopolymer transport system component
MKSLERIKVDNNPKLFLPHLIKQLAHSCPTFTRDGCEMYWSTIKGEGHPRTIYFSVYEDGKWSEPQIAEFSGEYNDDHPCISFDGNVLYFASNRPLDADGEMELRIWKALKTDSGWDRPVALEKPIGSWTPSVTEDGTIYFLDYIKSSSEHDSTRQFGIFKSELVNGKYITAELLPSQINLDGFLNWCPFISADESFLLFSSDRPGSSACGDIYISFHNNGDWSEAVNLGPSINTEYQERFPGLTPDGKQLFFTRSTTLPNHHDMYWVDAGIINDIRMRMA